MPTKQHSGRSAERLSKILRADDAGQAADFFEGANEADRRGFARQVTDWCRLLELNWRAGFSKKAEQELRALEKIDGWHDLQPAAQSAALACLDLAELKALGSLDRVPPEISVTILRDRRPPWSADYAEWLCEGELHRWSGAAWKQVRALVRSGLCPAPRHDSYALGALNGIWPRFDQMARLRRLEQGKKPLPEPDLVELLLAERDWLENGFWRLFELEGTGEVSLANCEKYGRSSLTWTDALLALSRRDILPRARLLDATLVALSRDFIQFRAGWFSRFHDALRPTPAECAPRAETYFRLLGSSIPPTVACALEALVAADKAKALPARRWISALEPVLAARGKAVVMTALKVLDGIAHRDPGSRGAACLSAASALLHQATEVQRASLELLERHGDRQDTLLRARVAEAAGAVAGSSRARVAVWLGDAALGGAVKRGTPSPPTVAVPPGVQRTDPTRAVRPVADLDDLILLASAVLEAPADPVELERVLDGISRLGDRRPEDFQRRTGPLRKRALKTRDDKQGDWPTRPGLDRALAMLILSWIDQEDAFVSAPENLAHGQNQYAFLFRRLWEVARRACAGQALPLLSAPTHVGGWITPAVLVERWVLWQRAGAEPDEHDQVLALLRLAPEGRDAVLAEAAGVQGEGGRALRLALGAREKTGRAPGLWLAAWRSRQPQGDLPEFEPIHPRLGPDAGSAARYSWEAACEHHRMSESQWISLELQAGVEPKRPRAVGDTLLPVLFHGDWGATEDGERNLIRWGAQLWPAQRESFFARAASRLPLAVNSSDVMDRDLAAYLEPLADPHTVLGPMACLVLALGLAAQDNALRGHAQEGLIASIQEGRLPVEAAGATMARLLDTGFNKLTRWAKALGEVARVTPDHARCTAELLQHVLHADPTKAPRDVSALLELLLELLCELHEPLRDAEARRFLSGLTTGGKTAKVVRRLLATSA